MPTLASKIIDHCRGLGIELLPTETGIRCLAPLGALTSELQDLLKAKRDNVRDALIEEEASFDQAFAISFDDSPAQLPPQRQWSTVDGAVADFVLLLTPYDLPEPPFELDGYRTVVDSEKYLRALHRDIQAGPRGARYRSGVLMSELKIARDLLLEHYSTITMESRV